MSDSRRGTRRRVFGTFGIVPATGCRTALPVVAGREIRRAAPADGNAPRDTLRVMRRPSSTTGDTRASAGRFRAPDVPARDVDADAHAPALAPLTDGVTTVDVVAVAVVVGFRDRGPGAAGRLASSGCLCATCALTFLYG